MLPQGEIGMIEIRGPNVFKGYWRMPEKTKAEFRDDGFFISGDLGYVDARGYVYISGRGKDLIISGGFNVYPAEVEGAIEALPGVAECAVIGVPHADFGEGVVAVVTPKPGADARREADASRRSAASSPSTSCPSGSSSPTSLPRNAMGKVQKNELREKHQTTFTAALSLPRGSRSCGDAARTRPAARSRSASRSGRRRQRRGVLGPCRPRIELCLFDGADGRETARLPLPERTDGCSTASSRAWPRARSTACAPHGPWAPERGHRFNPNRLLLDPYARAVTGRFRWEGPNLVDPAAPLAFDPRDSAALVPKGVVRGARPREPGGRPRHAVGARPSSTRPMSAA